MAPILPLLNFLLVSSSLFFRDSGVVDHLSGHHRAHPPRQQQAVSLSPTGLSARGEYGEDSMSDKFTEGQDVLARWSDGLFYLGTITKVSVRGKMSLLSQCCHLSQYTRSNSMKFATIVRIYSMCQHPSGISGPVSAYILF